MTNTELFNMKYINSFVSVKMCIFEGLLKRQQIKPE